MLRRSDETPRRRSVLLSELTGTKAEGLPLPVRRKQESEDYEEDSPKKKDVKSPDRAEKPDRERERQSAYERAMSILACGDNSERQIREKLEKKGYRYSEIADAVEMLKKKRYLRDQELMERYAAALSKKRMYGAGRIRLEMLLRFDREVVEEYFEEAVCGIDFDAVAAIAAEKCAGRDREYRIRRLRYLGFTSDQIRKALKQEKSIDE